MIQLVRVLIKIHCIALKASTSICRSHLIVYTFLLFVHIILKYTFFYGSIWKYNSSYSMLNTLLPFTFITTTISPEHRSKSLPFVFIKGTFINISTRPSKDTLTMFHIIKVLSFVYIAIRLRSRLLPFSFALFLTFYKISSINLSI